MDNKEAAEILKAWSTDEYPLALLMKAVDVAIKALEHEPCEDVISRQVLKDLGAGCIAKRDENGNLIPLGSIDSLPSVSQKQEIPIDCSDSICRADAIKLVKSYIHEIITESGVDKNSHTNKILTDIVKFLAFELPSVSTKKAGRWIAQDIHNCHTDFKCSECGYIHSFMHLYGEPTADYTYCPNCGAKMEVDE